MVDKLGYKVTHIEGRGWGGRLERRGRLGWAFASVAWRLVCVLWEGVGQVWWCVTLSCASLCMCVW